MEQGGVDTIPDEERTSGPRDLVSNAAGEERPPVLAVVRRHQQAAHALVLVR